MATKLQLPTNYNVPPTNIFDYNWLFSGGKGTGKTAFSIALAGPEHIVIQGEPGNCKHLSNCRFVDVYTWEELVGYLDLIKKTPNYCKNIILDDIPSLHALAIAYVRKEKGWEDQPGKKFTYPEWGYVRNLFSDFLKDFKRLPYGKICTTHLLINEDHETAGGKIIPRQEPNIKGALFEMMEANFPFHFQGIIYKERDSSRNLYVNKDDFVLATNKFPNRFLYDDKPLISISMGSSPDEAASNFKEAFYNRYKGKTTDKKVQITTQFKQVTTTPEVKTIPTFQKASSFTFPKK